MNIHYTRLTLAAMISIAGLFALGVSVNFTDSVEYVGAVGTILGPLGILAAVLCGLAFSKYVATQSGEKKTSAKGVAAGFWLIGAGAVVLSFMYGRLSVISVIPISIALVCFWLGSVANKYGGVGVLPPNRIKYLLIGGAFIGGVLPGLILYFILSLVVSERYCQLTSSKCL